MSASNEELKCIDDLMNKVTLLEAEKESLRGLYEYTRDELKRVQGIAVMESIKAQVWRYLARNEKTRSVIVEFKVLVLDDGWAVVFLTDVGLTESLPTDLRDNVWMTCHASSVFIPVELREIYNNITKKEDEE